MKATRHPSDKSEPTQAMSPEDGSLNFSASAPPLKRREFFQRMGGITAGATVLGLSSLAVERSTAAPDAKPPKNADTGISPGNGNQRRDRAFRVRVQAADDEKKLHSSLHPNNGDEDLYPNKIGSYSKGLPHNNLGEVDLAAYQSLSRALASGAPQDFEAIPLGSPVSARLKLVNPQSGLAFDLEGCDSQAQAIPPVPAFSSAEEAGEIVENYWMALLRDVPFSDYAANPAAQLAASDISALSDFRGPKQSGQVTAQTLFRGNAPGNNVGPYLSQFFYLPAPFGANFIEQRVRTTVSGVDYMTDYSDWLSIQRGIAPSVGNQFDPTRRYMRNGRDLSQWVHMDVLYQAYFHAMLILLTPPSGASDGNGLGAPFDNGNPYVHSQNQDGFGTFGGPHIAALMTEVATRALKAVWFQKWFVHRRLRPEAFAGRIQNHVSGAANYPIHSDALDSAAVAAVQIKNGNALLPMAFPEGCPPHPAYGAGHATVAGACVTILKAWFDESFVIPNPVQPTPDGLSLVPYFGAPLTVGGELNKLAANVAVGRNIAGVHWRSDATASLKLGEEIAISILRDNRGCYNEDFSGFTLTKFDGTTVTV